MEKGVFRNLIKEQNSLNDSTITVGIWLGPSSSPARCIPIGLYGQLFEPCDHPSFSSEPVFNYKSVNLCVCVLKLAWGVSPKLREK